MAAEEQGLMNVLGSSGSCGSSTNTIHPPVASNAHTNSSNSLAAATSLTLPSTSYRYLYIPAKSRCDADSDDDSDVDADCWHCHVTHTSAPATLLRRNSHSHSHSKSHCRSNSNQSERVACGQSAAANMFSAGSTCSYSNTSTCPAFDHNSSVSSIFEGPATSATDAKTTTVMKKMRRVAAETVVVAGRSDQAGADKAKADIGDYRDEDGGDAEGALRYSFKGYPPELYSPKKEFIYTRPLVEKQLVLKKTCEWWFYKNKCSNMSTHWKQNAFLIFTTCILLLVGLIIFFCLPIGGGSGGIRHATQMPRLTSLIDNTETTTTARGHNSTTTTTTMATMTTTRPSVRTRTTTSTTTTSTELTFIPTGPQFIDISEIVREGITHSMNGDDIWSSADDIESDIDDINKNSIPDEFTSDYVTPIKVDNFSLNIDDLLYESKRNHNVNSKKDYFSAFSATGTFRSKSSQIWDPHPEYTLNVFGNQLHLVLHQDTSFIPPKTFRVIQNLNNSTGDEEVDGGHYLGCYYKGYVLGDEQSAVAVSLCNGMTGYIKTSFGSLLIQPVNQTGADEHADRLHKVWRHARRNGRQAVAAADESSHMSVQWLERNVAPSLVRRKRHLKEGHLYTMEVLIAVDNTMVEFHRKNLYAYVLTLVSIVSNIFSDASIGNSIHITVANISMLKDFNARHANKPVQTASQLLNDFCGNISATNHHYDAALFLTRDPICSRGTNSQCDTLGLAHLGTACQRNSCAIVQDNGLPAAFTMAHELGHILNMPHDDDDRCRPWNADGRKPDMHIMSSRMGDDIHPWSWSDCSRYYVSEFLEKEDTYCLEDTPTSHVSNYNTMLPGEIYSLDQQCQLIHGTQSKYCAIDGECKRLWCKASNHLTACRSSNLAWADGTACKVDESKPFWCQQGRCVQRNASTLKPVNGGWGAWSPFTPCSLSCGGGVQESQRECNSPRPQNHGVYCKGSRKKYRSCNTQACPVGSQDPREQQCSRLNGIDHHIPCFQTKEGKKCIDKSVTWVPKYGLNSQMCKLFCRVENDAAYFQFAEKVIDGTTCSFDSFDKCINGICRPAGCDNELNSIAKLDKCGVCEGHNDTCEDFTGNFYVSDLYKTQHTSNIYYYHATTIPKGASNIVITQTGAPNDYTYIVLRDDQNNSLLNGKGVVLQFSNTSIYAGVEFYYSGSNKLTERVNTTYARKMKRDLIVEILSLRAPTSRSNDSLLLTYTYTMDKPYSVETEVEIYRWEMQAWSHCDALCHGRSHRLPACVSTMQDLKVAPQFCDQSAKPVTEYRNCNTECVLSLNISGISECSAACGMWGTRELTHQCIQTFSAMGRSSIVDLSYCAVKFEFSRHEQCREGCWDVTDWTPCSKSCGSGTQTRGIACFINQTRVSDTICNQYKKMKAETLQMCNVEACRHYEENTKTTRSMVNNWITSDWGSCDDKCEKTRSVTCRSPHGYGCASDKAPIAKRKCCKIKYISNWSNCSVECGVGQRIRQQHCARVYKAEIKGARPDRTIIDRSYCRNERVPTLKRTSKPCKVSCKWSTSPWSACPADCSKEYQTRSVYCDSMLGTTVAHNYCSATPKPVQKKICSNCVKRVAKCTCTGVRWIGCYDSKRRLTTCPFKVKRSRRKCIPPRNCQPQTCADVQRRNRVYTDGDYTLYVRSRPKTIYCHNMNTSAPQEYVTLNPIENYSIYYDYKTHNPDKCPPKSRHDEFRDNTISAGRTNFRRIRIDIKDLRVIETDYTFAETRGVPQPYGSAGDCYNRNRACPQGDFSMSLAHSGFHIRPGTVWDKFGSSVIMKVSNSFETATTSRRAFCGGYCGRCAISPNDGLYLDV